MVGAAIRFIFAGIGYLALVSICLGFIHYIDCVYDRLVEDDKKHRRNG